MTLGIIGAGNLAGAILQGIQKTGALRMESIFFAEANEARARQVQAEFGIKQQSVADLVQTCDVLLVAVKPHQIQALLGEMKNREAFPLVISTAAGVTLERLADALPQGAPVVRIMPNLNASIAQSMTAYCKNEFVSARQEEQVKTLCTAFGEVLFLEESYFSAFFVLAGSGPAFAFLFIEQLARAGVQAGLPKDLALRTAAQTVSGSAQLIQQSGEHPQALIDRVCSPGGITIAGIAALQENGFENAINQAVSRAVEKEKNL